MYINLTDAAELAGVTRGAIQSAIRRGELSKIEVGGWPLVTPTDVKDWMRRPRFKANGRIPKRQRQEGTEVR